MSMFSRVTMSTLEKSFTSFLNVNESLDNNQYDDDSATEENQISDELSLLTPKVAIIPPVLVLVSRRRVLGSNI